MTKRCYVACIDEVTKNIINQGIKSINSHMDIVNVDNEGELIFKLHSDIIITM